jgi:hypothetical protein
MQPLVDFSMKSLHIVMRILPLPALCERGIILLRIWNDPGASAQDGVR